MTLLCIVPGPSLVLREEADDKPRWCFKCRQRHLHTWFLLGDPPDADGMPSWYEPIWVRRCPTCRGDYTAFPGPSW